MKHRYLLSLILSFFLLSCCTAQPDVAEKDFKICFPSLSVVTDSSSTKKNGDCAVLFSPDGKVMVIDCGYYADKETFLSFLKSMGVEKIDYLVITHPHGDHIGGLYALAPVGGSSLAMPITRVYRSYLDIPTDTMTNLKARINEYAIPETLLKTGDTFMFGSSIKVTVLAPDEDITDTVNTKKAVAGSYTDMIVNNASLCLRLTYGETSVLFCGDLYKDGEDALITKYGSTLKSTMAKANHHGFTGTKTWFTNTQNWVDTISPSLTVTTGNYRPSPSIVTRYQNSGSTVLRTVDGTITVKMDRKGGYETTQE